jgi:hypothetical protein
MRAVGTSVDAALTTAQLNPMERPSCQVHAWADELAVGFRDRWKGHDGAEFIVAYVGGMCVCVCTWSLV